MEKKIDYFGSQLEEEYNKVINLVNQKKGTYKEDQYDTKDLIIYTEEYQEEYLKEYLKKHQDYFAKIDNADLEDLIEEVKKAKPSNPLIVQLQKDPNSKRIHSIKSIVKS